MTEFLVVIPITMGSFKGGSITVEEMLSLLISINIFGISALSYICFRLKNKNIKFNLDTMIEEFFTLSVFVGLAAFVDIVAAIFLLSYLIQILLF